MMLFHLTTVYKDNSGVRVNRFGEPFTVKEEGLKRSHSHPVCLTPSLGHVTAYVPCDRRAARVLVYKIDSGNVPGINEGRVVWTSEHVPREAIGGMIQVQVTEQMTQRDIQYQIEKQGKLRGWL